MSTDQTGTQDKLDAGAALAAQEISRDTLLEKYTKNKESSIEEMRRRVARTLAQTEPKEKRAH